MATVDWRRELLKALLPVALALGYAFWLRSGATHGGAKFWGIVAVLIVPAVAAQLASGRLRAAGREGFAGVLKFGGLAWLVGGYLVMSAKTQAVTLTDAERGPFVTMEDRAGLRLQHSTLGFSVLHPGPGFTERGDQAFRRDTHFYWFADPGAGVRLTIGLFKGQGDAQSMRDLLETMSREIQKVGGPANNPTRVVELETAAGDAPTGHMHVVLGDGRHYRVNAYRWQGPQGAPFAILIAVMSAAPDACSDVLTSFRP